MMRLLGGEQHQHTMPMQQQDKHGGAPSRASDWQSDHHQVDERQRTRRTYIVVTDEGAVRRSQFADVAWLYSCAGAKRASNEQSA
jgi:hypothetical protein